MMYHRITHNPLLITAMLSFLITSCQSERIQVSPKEEYNREFIKNFGVPDSRITWNAAARIKAEISPSLLEGADRVKIFTAWTSAPNCRLIASFPVDSKSFEFDFPQNLNYAFVQIVNADGRVLHDNYAKIDNGLLRLGSAPSRTTQSGEAPIYAYDLTSHPALGTFPYNEPYNREFWKQTAIWKDPVSETGPNNIDTETVHTIWTGNTSIDYYWPNVPDTSNGGSLSYAFSDVVSNRLSITVKYQLSKECNGNHNDLDQSQVVITLVDGVNEKASGYRPISEMEEGKEYEFTIETTPKETEQLKKNFYIKGTHVTATS